MHFYSTSPSPASVYSIVVFVCVCAFAVGSRYVEEANDRAPSGSPDPDVAERNQKVGFQRKLSQKFFFFFLETHCLSQCLLQLSLLIIIFDPGLLL